MSKLISGFSKLTKEEKISWLTDNYLSNKEESLITLKKYWNSDVKLQELHDDFIENTITNYYMPFGVAPNFIINDKELVIPMVTEESSVVAAASLVAKFWSKRGGFKAEVISTKKNGQVHFMFAGKKADLKSYFDKNKTELFAATASITKNMEKRGGGILDIKLVDKTDKLANYYQLNVTFETVDSMGANFINSCLEAMANKFRNDDIEIVMSILSNYVPECLVRAEVSCKIEDLGGENPQKFAQKFYQAVKIAQIEPYRAVTHNKGVMNGIDAVVLATGNDFRAIEAGAHAFAAKSGTYKSLTHCEIEEGVFKFWIEIPLAVGTVGGLTALHPMAKLSLELLQQPTAKELMQIMATAGLAQNYAALRALTTKGIQHGHMKMHLMNILNQLNATNEEKNIVENYFDDKTVSHSAVVEKLESLRKKESAVNWVDFLDTAQIKSNLQNLKTDKTPIFGKMNVQQMIEHLSFIVQISNGKEKVDYFVEDEKAQRRQPFLDSDLELQVGFRAPILAEEPIKEKFETKEKAIEDLINQIDAFKIHHKENIIENHPFFGELNSAQWKKFQVKHFTHHFKQFGLI